MISFSKTKPIHFKTTLSSLVFPIIEMHHLFDGNDPMSPFYWNISIGESKLEPVIRTYETGNHLKGKNWVIPEDYPNKNAAFYIAGVPTIWWSQDLHNPTSKCPLLQNKYYSWGRESLGIKVTQLFLSLHNQYRNRGPFLFSSIRQTHLVLSKFSSIT